MRPIGWAAVTIVAAALWSSIAHATPVDAERLNAIQSKKGWVAAINFTGAYRSGNINRLEFGFDGTVQYQSVFPAHRGHPWRTRPPHAPLFFKDRWLLMSQVRWAQLDGNRFINSGVAHTRYTRMLIPRLGLEGFGQTQYNEFTLLGSRLILGTGARVDVVHRRRVGMWFGSGYMAEWEVNDTVAGDPHPARVLNHRWANRGVFQLYLIDGKLLFQNSLYAQPRLTSFADVRILDSARLEGMITEILSIGGSFELQYDSRPPQTVTPVDIMLATFLKVSFG